MASDERALRSPTPPRKRIGGLDLGLFGWFEFSGDVTLQRDASALGAQASRIPPEWQQMEIYQGTQVFVGPLLGIGFGH